MRELLIRTISGVAFVGIVLACIFISPWTFAALALFVTAIGTFEMARLFKMDTLSGLIVGEGIVVSAFLLAVLVGLSVIPARFLCLERPLLITPFLFALFSKKHKAKEILSFVYASVFYLAMPMSLMLFFYRGDLFGSKAGPLLLLLVFALLWVNDIFAYLSGRLLGKHKLFPRISPGKTIEGSIGGLVFTALTIAIFSHYFDWMSVPVAIGLASIAVAFGTLGDLSESMLKRQAGVKDSGKLIPGHGGILDRFDSVLLSVPFIFVYLLLL